MGESSLATPAHPTSNGPPPMKTTSASSLPSPANSEASSPTEPGVPSSEVVPESGDSPLPEDADAATHEHSIDVAPHEEADDLEEDGDRPPGPVDDATDYEDHPGEVRSDKDVDERADRHDAGNDRRRDYSDDEDGDKSIRERTKEASKQVKQYGEYIQLMEDRVSQLEEKLRKLEGREDELKEKRNQKPTTTIIPKLRRVKWIDFMYRHVEEKEVYAIEVLVGGARYYYQRSEGNKGGPNENVDMQGVNTKLTSLAPDGSSGIRRELPERMRVNSNRIISILADLDPGTYFAMEPFVMLRPFKYLTCNEAKIRNYLQKLEAKWGDVLRKEDDNVSSTNDGKAVNDLQVSSEDQQPDQPTNISTTAEEDTQGPKEVTEKSDDAEYVDDRPREGGQHNEKPEDEATMGSDKVTPTQVNGESIGAVGATDSKQDSNKPTSEEMIDSPDALRDFRCVVDFMDQELKPTLDMLKEATCRKVYFSDLWHLFKPGEEVLTSLANKSGDQVLEPSGSRSASQVTFPVSKRSHERYQTAWRVLRTVNGRPNLTSGDEDDNDDDPPKVKMNAFQLRCYYIDFDGKRFCPVTHCFRIQPFEGERDVTSLEIYPTRFAENASQIRADLKKRGAMFREFTTFKHRYYTGSTLVCHPCGCSLGDRDQSRYPENIDSQVIVDFHEALQSNGDWFPSTSLVESLVQSERESEEAYPAAAWKGHDERYVSQRDLGLLFLDARVDEKLRDEYMAKSPLLSNDSDQQWQSLSVGDELNDDDLVLLPARVFAFVLRDRKFALLRLENLRPVRPQADGFNSLKLPHGHKRMVRALVNSHFNAKNSKSTAAEDEHEFDLVRGKGKGLIVLLHGAPGVGKTSTAECVAESNGKPLFPITCGDLGLTAQEVEHELAEKFHLAQQWDCVLLLDEADVFLAQRTKTDLKRNSLVSVFLRVLEYYTGILFLTTNRVGAFDEAFKSRIHISLYYPPLSKEQTISIWKMNMERTMERKKGTMLVDKLEVMDFAQSHYEESTKSTRWNGRQIRNAFQTASALSEYEAYEENEKRKQEELLQNHLPSQPKLEIKHFKVVAQASLQFDDYITETTGFSDAERAQLNLERADHFRTRSGYGYREQSATYRSAPGPMAGPEQWPPQPGVSGGAPYQHLTRPQVPPMLQPRNPYQLQPPGQPATPPQRTARYAQNQYMTPEPTLPPFQQPPDPNSPWQQQSSESISKTSMSAHMSSETMWPEHSSRGVPGNIMPNMEARQGFDYGDDDY